MKQVIYQRKSLCEAPDGLPDWSSLWSQAPVGLPTPGGGGLCGSWCVFCKGSSTAPAIHFSGRAALAPQTRMHDSKVTSEAELSFRTCKARRKAHEVKSTGKSPRRKWPPFVGTTSHPVRTNFPERRKARTTEGGRRARPRPAGSTGPKSRQEALRRGATFFRLFLWASKEIDWGDAHTVRIAQRIQRGKAPISKSKSKRKSSPEK